MGECDRVISAVSVLLKEGVLDPVEDRDEILRAVGLGMFLMGKDR